MRTLERHRLSQFWPEMPEESFLELVEDIRKHGQRYPIILYGAEVMDGWHRYRACLQLAIKPKTEKFQGTAKEAADRVNSLNGQRRNVSESIRAFAITGANTWAESVQSRGGVSQGHPPAEKDGAKTNKELATAARTSEATIHRAKRVHKAGSQALKNAVKTGRVPLKKAAAVVDLPKGEQLAAATQAPKAAAALTVELNLDERWAPEPDEVQYLEKLEQENTASIDKIMKANDQMAAAYAEIKRQAAEIAVLKISRDGYMNERREIIKRYKALQKETEGLRRKLGAKS